MNLVHVVLQGVKPKQTNDNDDHDVMPLSTVSSVRIVLQGVFEVDHEEGLTLVELADGVSVQEVIEATDCEFKVSLL